MDNATKNLPDNKKFLVDVMSAIERYDKISSRKPSRWYKPSSFHCLRNMRRLSEIFGGLRIN